MDKMTNEKNKNVKTENVSMYADEKVQMQLRYQQV